MDGTKTNEMEETTTKPSNRPAKPIYTFPNLPTEVCNCFANSVAEWNKTPPDQRVRDDIFRNSNWVLKCALKRCGLTAPLGEPGYRGNSSKCLVWKQEYRLPIASGGPAVSCTLVSYCAKFQECPDGFDENVLAVKSN